jgi:hypothetical protein
MSDETKKPEEIVAADAPLPENRPAELTESALDEVVGGNKVKYMQVTLDNIVISWSSAGKARRRILFGILT